MKLRVLPILLGNILLFIALKSSAQSFSFQPSPTGAYISAPHIFPNGSNLVQKVGLHYSACELKLRSAAKLMALTFETSSTGGLNAGALVNVYLDNSDRCDLRAWRPWQQVVDSADAFGQAQIVIVNSTTFRLVLASALSNAFVYKGAGLDVFFEGLGQTSNATLSGFESAGNIGFWGTNLPIYTMDVIRPVMGGNYTLTTQNIDPTCIRTHTCSGQNQYCPGESVCLYLQKQDGLFTNDAALNFSWERTSTPCIASSWLSIPASNSASFSFNAPVVSGVYYYRCKISDGANIFYSSLSGTCGVAGCNDYFFITVAPVVTNLGCYDAPDSESLPLGARISEVEMKVNGALLLKSNTNYINGICTNNSDVYSVVSRPNATFPLTSLVETPIVSATQSWLDFSDALLNQGLPEVHPGDLVSFKVRMSNCDKPMLYNHLVRLEFDWDNNQTFETIYNFNFAEAFPLLSYYQGVEESLLLNPLDADSVVYLKNFIVPCDIVCGPAVVSKFRVSLKRLPTGWGDAEDYAIKSLCNDVSINYTGSTTICLGDSKLLGVGSGSSFQWNKNGVPITGATGNSYLASQSGTYTVTVDIGGCLYTSSPVVIIVESPSVSAGSDFTKSCISNTTGANVGEASVAGYAYAWSPSTGLSSSLVSNPLANPSSSTTYTVTKTNTTTGCSATDQVVVAVDNALPLVNAGLDLNVCSGDFVTLNGSGANTYSWNNGVTDGISFQPLATGYFVVQGTNSNGCSSKDSLLIQVQTPVIYFLDADGDGFGDTPFSSCLNPGAGYVLLNGDCNDTQANIHPGLTELCNGWDDNCNGVVDEGCGVAGIALLNAQLTSTPQFGMPGTNYIHNVNMALASDYPESSSGVYEKWFKFQALSNAMRIEVVGASTSDDNSIRVFADPGISYVTPLSYLTQENDVNLSSIGVLDQGNEILLTDQLIQGNWYYACITTVAGTPGNIVVKFNALLPSTCDVMPFTAYTGVYSNVCQTFKCQYRTQARRAIIHRWIGASQVGLPLLSYTIPAPTSLITTCQLAKIVPANMSGSSQTIYISADLEYDLLDAAGNMNILFAIQPSNCSFQLSSEPTSNVRSIDECPVYKSAASSVATDRSVCGAMQYQWEYTMVYPSPALPVSVNGSLNSRILTLAAVPGMVNGQRYDVRIRSLYSDALTYTAWTPSPDCIRTLGAAGMSPLNDASQGMAVLSNIALFPNPTRMNQIAQLQWVDVPILEVVILNAMGQQVHHAYVSDSENRQLTLSATLPAGLYQVLLRSADVVYSTPWLIE
ncbi:MAG: hypothetical protein RL609_1198 [Bacteroidota bacterium]